MKIYFISPIGMKTPMLFDTFIPTFESKGHTIVSDIKECSVVFIDLCSFLGKFETEEWSYTWKNKIPVVFFDATDYGAMSKEVFKPSFLEYFFSNCKIVYFMRKMDKTIKYPLWVFPYEIIQYPDHDFTPVSKEELFNRPYDICFIGNTSPTRENVCNGLRCHFKCDFVLGQPRIEHEEWLNRHRNSKLFLVADGGGFNDERAYQLITISTLLKQDNNQLVLNDFEDVVDCIKVNEYPTRFDIEDLQLILSESHTLYSIYLNGIKKMKKYYNPEYRANYILNVLKENGI